VGQQQPLNTVMYMCLSVCVCMRVRA